MTAAGEPGEPVSPAVMAAEASGVPFRLAVTPQAGSAEESAELQGIPLGALLRTIVVRRGEDDFVFVLVPAGRRFDWPLLRNHLGVKRLSLPDADEALAVTGYVRYTITPFGSTRAWPVILDAAAMAHDSVSVGGGVRGSNLQFSPGDLVRALDATIADVSVAEPESPSRQRD